MAGIGFVLRKMAGQDTMLSGMGAYMHAAVISCGPWLFTVLSLSGIEIFGRDLVNDDGLHRFSAVVMYDFSLSLVVSGPIVLVATRRLADQIYAKDVSEVAGIYVSALVLLLGVQAALGIPLFTFLFDLDLSERILAVVLLQVAGSIWLAASFLSALKGFGTISAAFAAGTVLACVAALLLAPNFGAAGLLAGFAGGLSFIFFVLSGRILGEYPGRPRKLHSFLPYLFEYWEFAAVGLLYNAAIWVDKWIMWFAPGQGASFAGIPSHPIYDGAMFLAYLTVVPAMTLFLVVSETRFYERYLEFYQNVENDGTAAQIDRNHGAILRVLREALRNIAVLQAAVCYLTILAAPALIGMARGALEMVPVFRFGVLGAYFHVLLLCAMVIISYFDLRRELVIVTASFFLLNAGLTLAALHMGLGYLGYGYCAATLLSLGVAWWVAVPPIMRLPYTTFIGNNRGLR